MADLDYGLIDYSGSDYLHDYNDYMPENVEVNSGSHLQRANRIYFRPKGID